MAYKGALSKRENEDARYHLDCRVIDLRAKGMTWDMLAEITGIAAPQLCVYFGHSSAPMSPTTLSKIVAALGGEVVPAHVVWKKEVVLKPTAFRLALVPGHNKGTLLLPLDAKQREVTRVVLEKLDSSRRPSIDALIAKAQKEDALNPCSAEDIVTVVSSSKRKKKTALLSARLKRAKAKVYGGNKKR